MATLCQAIMANFNKIVIMAILVWVVMAINMVNKGVYVKNRKNVEPRVRCLKKFPFRLFYDKKPLTCRFRCIHPSFKAYMIELK